MTYQPIWRDGSAVHAGERDCADRYEAIRQVLDQVEEPFTLLDLGAAEGYFSVRAAEDFDCRVTAIDPNPKLSEAASDNVATYVRRVDARRLRTMARHDVVLALSVLHHFTDWRGVLAQVRACRQWAIIEVPHPDERWLRKAAARRELRQIHDAVAAVATRTLGTFPRTGRDGSVHERTMFLVPGTVERMQGQVFTGSGTNTRRLTEFGRGLDTKLGYRPVPGSLNLRLEGEAGLGSPALDWVGRRGSRTRDYQFWQAWAGKMACHAMVPGARGHGPDALELVAPVRLRDHFALADGDTLGVDVEPTSDLLRLESHGHRIHMWASPGKIAKCWRAGKPYERPLLEHIRTQGFRGTAVDAGANIGNHTLWLAEVCGLNVVAFEPIKVRELERNVAVNELGDRVRVEPVGLGETTTTAAHVGKGRLTPGQGGLPVRRLDDYHLTDVSVIKVDIEGMEAQMLRGGEETIRRDLPVIFAEEWGQPEHDAIAQVLEPWGYSMTERFHSKGSPTPVGRWDHTGGAR